MRLLFDLECDGLLETASTVHCIAAIDVDTGERYSAKPDEVKHFVEDYLEPAEELIGHNIQAFDIPVLGKVFGVRFGAKLTDTLILAKLQYPDLKRDDIARADAGGLPASLVGRQSLEAWGHRLGAPKDDYAKIKALEAGKAGIVDVIKYTWGQWSPEMQSYMVQDCETNLVLYRALLARQPDPRSIRLEHRIAAVCEQMGHAGVPFDMGKASELHSELVHRRGSIERALVDRFGSWEVVDRVFVPKRDNKRLGYTAGQQVTKHKTVVFNPSSRQHIGRVLCLRGWQPSEFTPGGQPVINEETVSVIAAQFSDMADLGDYLMLDKRIGQLFAGKNSLINSCTAEGRIHGRIDPMGTVTGRGAHFSPNLGQVPNSGSPYGPEFRSLFAAPEGYQFVGADMAGLELRGLAHYLYPLDGGSYAKTVLEGDPHWTHTVAMGLISPGTARDSHDPRHTVLRNASKTFVYGYIYGAGAHKCGEIIYKDAALKDPETMQRLFPQGPSDDTFKSVGNRIRQKFVKGISGFNELRKKVAAQYERHGWMPGLDGRRIPCRSEHSALNAMIQSAGAVLCKRWVCDLADSLPDSCRIVLWVHDEVQVLVPNKEIDNVKRLAVSTAAAAGTDYGFRVRLDSEAKSGNNWNDTH